jgi:hypothetical protein
MVQSCVAEDKGIMDTVLRPHLQAITKVYKAEESKLLSKFKPGGGLKGFVKDVFDGIMSNRLKTASEHSREQGNQFFKVHQDYNQALHMYTQSIATATEEPLLASLAYNNRSQSRN